MKQISIGIKLSIFFMVTLMFPSMLHAGDIYEAEDAVISGAAIASNHTGYSGTGFVDYQNASNDYIEWTVNATNAGQYILNFGYALGNTDRPLEIRVNGQVVAASQSFPGTGGWTSWDTTANLNVNFNAGSNTIRATAIGSSGANVDYLEVTAVTGPNPEPILSITKDSNISGDILPGDMFTYTIVVENDASATGDATNVTVRDPLPTGVTYVSGTAEKKYYVDDGNTGSFPHNMGTVTYGNGGNGTTQTFTVTTANSNIPTGAVLTSYQLTTKGTITGIGWLEDVGMTALTPGGGTAYTLDPGHFGGSGNGSWNESEPTTTSIAGNPALGTYDLEWTTAYNFAGDVYTVDEAIFTIEWAGRGITTDAANAPENLVTAADNITIKPGETLTVTFQVKADDDLTNISDITNTAYAASTEITTEISASTTNNVLPVTISHVYPESYGDTIEVTFGTATETGNLGFNIYGLKGNGKRAKWIKLNEKLIPGALDSFEPQEYTASVSIPEGMQFKKIGIAGVDVEGTEDRHGPFKIGKQTGEKSVAIPVNWTKVRQEVKADRKAKKAAKKAAKKGTRQTLKDEVVTLKVSEKAVYKVTHDDLLAEGIDLSGFKANKIALSFKDEGVARYISELNKNDKWTKNSAIEFIGERPNATDALYVKENHYRVSLDKELVVESEAIEPFTTKEIVVEQNKRYGYTLPLSDPFYEEHFYTRNESDTGTHTSQFDMPFIPHSGTSALSIITAVSTKGTHHMTVTLNGETVADSTTKGASEWKIEAEVDNGIFQESGNELKFTLYGEGDGFDFAAYDKLIISYDDGEEVVSLTPQIELNDKVRKKDIKVTKATNYLIISHPLFINETLERYVQNREGEGWKIQVVDVEDIYAAYSSGMPIPEAIQSYIKDATQKSVTHVQLIGAASYDYHDYLGTGSMSFIPSLYALTSEYIKYTPCDSCYVMGEDALPKVAIGRWPVRTLEGFENVVNKTLNWKNSGHSSNKKALLIADETDAAGSNFDKQSEKLANMIEAKGYSTKKVYLDTLNEENADEAVDLARESIQNSMLQGVSIVSFNGHGATYRWSKKSMLNQEDIQNIDNINMTPIAFPLTCMATYADSPKISTMAHQLLAAGENGAVAIYGASTYSSYGDNGIILGKVFNNLTEGQTLGEAILNKKRELGAEYQDVVRSGNLLGDVTLELK